MTDSNATASCASKIEAATELISKLSTEELNKVHKAIAEQKMLTILDNVARAQEEFKQLAIQIDGKKSSVAQYIAQVNHEISPLHASMQAKVTYIQKSVNSLTTICDDANANIDPNRVRNATNSYSYYSANNANLVAVPSVVVPEMPQSSFVAAPKFVHSISHY
jgi:hypothetical protein